MEGDFLKAEEFFLQALSVRTDDVTALRLTALMVAFQDRLDEALVYIERAANRAPDDVDVLVSYARILSWQEDFLDAEEIIDTVIARAPAYADAWALKGRIAYYRQNLGESEKAFDTAQSLDPGNLEVLLGLGDVARAQNRVAEARRFFTTAQARYPNDREVLQRLVDLDKPQERTWRIDVDSEHSQLSRTALSDWSAQTVRLENRFTAATILFGTGSIEGRFDKHDVSMQFGLVSRLSDELTLYGDAGFTPGADFLPEWQIGGGGTLRLIEGAHALGPGLITADLRTRRYDVGTIHTGDIGWQQYLNDGRVWVWGKVLNTIDAQDKHLTGWSLSAWWSISEQLGLRVGLSDAPESDRGVVVETRSYTFAAEYEFSPYSYLRFGVEHHERENSYRRKVLRFGAGTRF